MPDSSDAIQRERLREIALAEKLADIRLDFEAVTCNKRRLMLANDLVRTQAELNECRRILGFQITIPIEAL